MDRRMLEDDLIDLLDGRLTTDRAARVRSAFSADPGLRRVVEQMVSDRSGVARVARQDESLRRTDGSSSRDAVRVALERAEREGLVGSADARLGLSRSASHGRHRRWVAGGALAALLALVVGVSSLVGFKGQQLVNSIHQGGQRNDPVNPDVAVAPVTDEPSDAATQGGGAAFGPRGPDDAPPLDAGRMAQVDQRAHQVEELRRTDREQLESWSGEALALAGIDPNGSWRALPSDQMTREASARAVGGDALSLDDAAVLAFSHRLRVVLPASGGESAIARARAALAGGVSWREMASSHGGALGGVSGANPGADSPADESAPASSERRWTLDVRVPLDPERRAVRGALQDIINSVLSAGLPEPRIELASQDPSAASPATTIQDVLWWTSPATEWSRRVSLRVEVVVR